MLSSGTGHLNHAPHHCPHSSELVAAALKAAGRLPQDLNSSLIVPGDFAENNDKWDPAVFGERWNLVKAGHPSLERLVSDTCKDSEIEMLRSWVEELKEQVAEYQARLAKYEGDNETGAELSNKDTLVVDDEFQDCYESFTDEANQEKNLQVALDNQVSWNELPLNVKLLAREKKFNKSSWKRAINKR